MLGVLDKYRENARKNKNDSKDQIEEQKLIVKWRNNYLIF